ncbi:MAG: hypothetical protein EZS28_050586, partial [Streblomastix strix]
YKQAMNSSYGIDGMNQEKYSQTKLLSSDRTWLSHLQGSFVNDQQITDDLYAVQFNAESCNCNTCLHSAYFVLDNSKYWMHYICGDTDSMTWAISGNPNAEEGYRQKFKYSVMRQKERHASLQLQKYITFIILYLMRTKRIIIIV